MAAATDSSAEVLRMFRSYLRRHGPTRWVFRAIYNLRSLRAAQKVKKSW